MNSIAELLGRIVDSYEMADRMWAAIGGLDKFGAVADQVGSDLSEIHQKVKALVMFLAENPGLDAMLYQAAFLRGESETTTTEGRTGNGDL